MTKVMLPSQDHVVTITTEACGPTRRITRMGQRPSVTWSAADDKLDTIKASAYLKYGFTVVDGGDGMPPDLDTISFTAVLAMLNKQQRYAREDIQKWLETDSTGYESDEEYMCLSGPAVKGAFETELLRAAAAHKAITVENLDLLPDGLETVFFNKLCEPIFRASQQLLYGSGLSNQEQREAGRE